MARRPARGPQTRPVWTRLGVLGAILVAVYATMVGTGTFAPRLGLDLQGGTSVILTPKATNGQKIPAGALDQAVDIIRERVNGLGVTAAEVVKQGNNIDISVPGKDRSNVVGLVGQTAELRFREVALTADATAAATSTTPSASPSTSGSPSASPSASPSTTPSPSATPAPSPTASSTSRSDVLSKALLAPTAAAAAATTAAATTAPAATPSLLPSSSVTPVPTPSATSTSSAESEAEALAATGAPEAAQLAFIDLTCSKTDVVQGSSSNDTPGQWIASCDKDGTTKYLLKPATVVGTDVKSATATTGTSSQGVSTGVWEVDVSFTGKGQSKFTALTEATINKQVAIVLDGVVQSAPTIDSRIAGDAQISGSFTEKTANDLANVLKYGSLPIAFQKQQAESVSATLGKDSLNAGLLAGGIGLILVVIYSFVYYRALGLVTVFSLLISGSLVYGTVSLLGKAIGFTLTLAGIAGLIVAVGVTADSFVVFFERLKDEVREGRSIRTGVERGWARARRTILSADTVSFLAAAVLYYLSIGDVRGFAFTLGISTLLDVVVVFLFTKPVVTLLVRRRFFSTGRFSGLTVRTRRPGGDSGGGDSGGGGADSADPGPPRRPTLAKRAPAVAGPEV